MTLKKSMISVAAAGAIAALLTGCGSSGGSSSSSSSSSQPESLTATDGYVVNYTAIASYSDLDGNESNITRGNVTLSDALTTNTKAAGASQVAGSATLDLSADMTDAQIENLTSITISRVGTTTTDGTTLNYATYFDADGNGEFNTSMEDVLAPVGFAMKNFVSV